MRTVRDVGMPHKALVTRVIDGDTFECKVDLGFKVSIDITVRVFGCDAFEVHGQEKDHGIEAKEYVCSLLTDKSVDLIQHQQDSFGRWLCDVRIKNKDLVKMLSDKGFLKTLS